MNLAKITALVTIISAVVISAEAQIGNSEESARLLAMECSASSGYPVEGYLEYCRGLAMTLSFVTTEGQEEIFGFVPLQGTAQTPLGDLPLSLVDSGTTSGSESGSNSGTGSDSTTSGTSGSSGSGGSWWDRFLEWVDSLF